MTLPLKIGAFVVAYKDSVALNSIIQSLSKQTHKIDALLIVDNSPNPISISESKNSGDIFFEKMNFSDNIGISGALLVAQDWAKRLNIQWLWMFDQDSDPAPNALELLLSHLSQRTKIDDSIGIVSCGIYSSDSKQIVTGYDWKKYRYSSALRHSDTAAYTCDAVISSGSLINVSKMENIERLEERLFIDCVDFDLCRKFRAQGHSVYVVPSARLFHRLGTPLEIQIPYRSEPVTYFHLSPMRVFFICRNQSYIEFSNSKWIYWPLVTINRIRHCLYFIQGGLFSKPINMRVVFSSLLGLFYGFLSPKLWPITLLNIKRLY